MSLARSFDVVQPVLCERGEDVRLLPWQGMSGPIHDRKCRSWICFGELEHTLKANDGILATEDEERRMCRS